jgi:alkanesulfonate monooxygenase SsuD/methylene tetrahydromethanopterin reductase-like flavin-dependent oxidoreductase (luciferase family)
MDFGASSVAKIDDVDLAPFAEQLGFEAFSVMDSQLIWSDPYACLALIAERTKTIQVGTLAVVGTRIAPVIAAAIATINRLAPGRTFISLATGHTAWRMMGHPPRRLELFEEAVKVVRGLTRGETVPFRFEDRETLIRLDMADLGFVDTAHPIRIDVAAMGPKGTEIAGRLSDGILDPNAKSPARIAKVRAALNQAASTRTDAAAKDLTITATAHVVILDPGQKASDDHVIEQVGPMVALVLHEIYAGLMAKKAAGGPPPAAADDLPPSVQAVWQDYCALVDTFPKETRHLRQHAGHLVFVHPDEQRFITPELIKMCGMVAPAEELIETMRQLDAAGLDRLFISGSGKHGRASLERFSRLVMKRL